MLDGGRRLPGTALAYLSPQGIGVYSLSSWNHLESRLRDPQPAISILCASSLFSHVDAELRMDAILVGIAHVSASLNTRVREAANNPLR